MNTILRLFYDLTVYREIIDEPFVKTLFRFFFAYLILAGAYGLHLSRQYAPQVIDTTQTVLTTIADTTPTDAVFSISDYRLSTSNLALPHLVDNYIYLDSSTDILSTSSSAIITVSSSTIRFLAESNIYQTTSFKELELNNLRVTGQEIQNQLHLISQKITQFTPYLPILLSVPIFLGLSIARILQATFYALIFLLGVSLTNGHYQFKEIAKITFHSIIVAEVINFAILLVYGTSYPIIFSVAFIGISILAYFNLPARLKL